MNTREALDPEFVRSVVRHMNTDHPDSCVNIVRAFSSYSGASFAQLRDMDRDSLYFSVSEGSSYPSDPPPAVYEVKVDFPVPLRNELQVRGTLIELSGKAREILANQAAVS